MRDRSAIVVALCFVPSCATQEFRPFDDPEPLAVFIESDPWAMVIDADTPRVAIYENGEVIFERKVLDRPVYYHVTLDREALAKVHDLLSPVLGLKDLKTAYNIAPTVTDQPQAMFYLRDGQREVTTTVYGLNASETKLLPHTEFPTGPEPVIPPQELLKLHRWFCDLDSPEGQEWTPKYVEVMLWDYSYAPEASIQWPNDWPSLHSDRTIKQGEMYSIFLDGTMLPKLREFLATGSEKGAVELDSKKWAAAYRFTFPGDPSWRRAFEAAVSSDGDAGDH